MVEKNRFGNVTIEWSSSGNEQYQYLGSVSSQNLDQMNFTTLATMINVILEVGVNYSITVTAERCNGSVKSSTSKSLDIVLSGMYTYVHVAILFIAENNVTCTMYITLQYRML